ncbi:MAG: pyridoxamine 5'-phosphate oxidase family protein [Acidimicrobiales bacterium]|jgi:hypothetical protein
MGRTYDEIDERLRAFLLAQPVFFVSSAPLSAEGHVNCSPKSNNGELAILDATTVAFLDRTGSGAETIAHLSEPGNGRIVLMFCAFEGPPRIIRLHGRGEVVLRDEEGSARFESLFRPESVFASRSVIVVHVDRIADSCGYGVPLMAFQSHRTQADKWHDSKGEEGVREYWAENNTSSLDGLPGVPGPAAGPKPAAPRPGTRATTG